MCLSIPSRIVEINEDNLAMVETMGIRRQVSLDLMGDEIKIGDYVLIHVGYAMSKIDEVDALESLKLYLEIITLMEESESKELIDKENQFLDKELL